MPSVLARVSIEVRERICLVREHAARPQGALDANEDCQTQNAAPKGGVLKTNDT